MDKLGLTFQVEKDTKNIRRYQEEASDGPPIVGARATFNSGRCASRVIFGAVAKTLRR